MTITKKKTPRPGGVIEPNQSKQRKETIMNNTTSETQTCPRCLGPIEVHDDVKLAARSRATADRDIEICPSCGSDEAMRQHDTGVMVPVSEWPVEDPHEYHQPIQDTIRDGQVTSWLKNEYLPLRERETQPITGMNDPRVQALLEDPYHAAASSGLGFTRGFFEDLIEENPREAAEIYFLRHVEKPEPPLPMPAWAEHKEVLWGQYPEIGIVFTSPIRRAGNWQVSFERLDSIQILDDRTREPLDQAIVHEGPIQFEVSDGRNALLMESDISVIEQFAAAVDDAARHFARHLPREITRNTEPGAPSFEEGI